MNYDKDIAIHEELQLRNILSIHEKSSQSKKIMHIIENKADLPEVDHF